jgi:glycosyltransferase involved in cell wall biosynthesis
MEENKFFSTLKKKVDDLKRVKVKFNGWLTGESKLEQLREANFFVSPSLTEPFGFSLLEAMKSGLPVVSFSTEGPLDIIKPEFGRLVSISKSFDTMAKDFATAIIGLCYSDNYELMCEESNKAANQWRLDILLENFFSIL